jgi:signal transduction histidine kinase
MLLLLCSLSVLLGTAWQAERLQQQRHQTAVQLLHDYAAFGAWTYRQQLAIQIEESAWQTLNPVTHRDLHHSARMPSAASLIGYRARSLSDCRCDSTTRPSSYFSFVLGADSLNVAGEPLESAARASINRSLTSYLRDPNPPARHRMGILGPFEAVPSLVSYTLMPTDWADTVVYGFVVDRASLVPTFQKILARPDLLPSAVSHGKRGNEILALEVRNRNGEVLYTDPRWPEQALVAEERLEPDQAGLVVRTTVLPAAASDLVAGGFSPNELPILLGVVLLAALMAIVALVQLRRETQLARIRSEFVASVSHELRTPLAQIRLFLDTLRLKRYHTDDQREWLVGHLTRETTRLEHLVDNVLLFSRMERNGSAPMAVELVELESLIRETAEGFAPLAQSRKVTLDLDLAPGLESRIDPGRLRQVLLNLLDNAVKFGPAGQRVTIRLARVNDQAELRVEDCGPGVPAGERQAIWEPYFRGARAGEAAVGGSGIGLAIVKDAVLRMQGEIRVESAPSGGAAFVVELPLERTSQAATNGSAG